VRAETLTTHLNSSLVFVSIAVAVIASFVALDLAQRSSESEAWVRRLWIGAAGVTMGLGIWSMHFIGMLALEMEMTVSYENALVVLSLVAAVGGSLVALAVVSRPQTSKLGVVSAAAFMGFAIAAMHYLGMASMQMDATIHWNVPLVVLSLAVGFGASLFALWLIVRIRSSAVEFGFARRLLASLLLGLGVAGLHYIAMASATFRGTVDMGALAEMRKGLRTDSLVALLVIGAGIMLAVLIGGAGVDRRRATLAKDLSLVANLARQLARLGGARERVCEAIRELSRADYVVLIEPDGEHGATVTAVDGVEPGGEYRQLLTSSHVRAGISDGKAAFIAELHDAERTHGLPGASSVLFEPLLLDGRSVGVLAVVWRERVRQLPERTATFLGMLAAEAAVAIDRETLLSQLEYLSRRDELTGLLNRRVLAEELERQIELSRAEQRPLAVVMLDMDHFKAYNDEHGHQAGDRLLRTAAAAWTAALREKDTIARYGGEEFVAVLPDCTLEAGVAVAEQLRRALPAGVTCSAGVATLASGASASDLIGRADRALYDAKRAGRDLTHADSGGLAARSGELPGGEPRVKRAAAPAAYPDR
jgi:diguanylate cyclase (GGDEF)-like protein